MNKKSGIEVLGTVVEAVRGAFRVQLNDNNFIVLCTLGGPLRKNSIKVVPGDKVKIEVSEYDYSRGRIIYREK